ncbi:Uncharacterized protein DBV15_04852 [Temnothorax longispinosus]|uniref:Uncharacterized protein n=1 Tax=Temnothorax longispinosus TaxID=300112 RepID=A0A4S2KGS8_9HYME|nr:Uncharacterized protein DBV15_04852 [Temnothorax longispinosus]
MSLVQIRQPVGLGPGPNILEEASETGDTNCDVTAVESHGRACIADSLFETFAERVARNCEPFWLGAAEQRRPNSVPEAEIMAQQRKKSGTSLR